MRNLEVLTLAEDENMKSNTNRPVIAIVDDDAFICRAMRRLVDSLGMDAVIFISGQEFVDLLETRPSFDPDCVILDVQMPGMNGLEVQAHLMRTRRNSAVVFMTGADEASIREQALASGAVAFLSKPFNNDLLVETLRRALKLASTKGR